MKSIVLKSWVPDSRVLIQCNKTLQETTHKNSKDFFHSVTVIGATVRHYYVLFFNMSIKYEECKTIEYSLKHLNGKSDGIME